MAYKGLKAGIPERVMMSVKYFDKFPLVPSRHETAMLGFLFLATQQQKRPGKAT